MFSKSKKTIKQLTDHEKNIDFAFHQFGFFGITQYRIMMFFWILQLTSIPSLLADALHANNATWSKMRFNIITGSWTLIDKTPSLKYVGCFIIVSAISHPQIIVYALKKATIFEFQISRALMDFKSLVFALFIALLSSRIVDLMLDVVNVFFEMEKNSGIIIF